MAYDGIVFGFRQQWNLLIYKIFNLVSYRLFGWDHHWAYRDGKNCCIRVCGDQGMREVEKCGISIGLNNRIAWTVMKNKKIKRCLLISFCQNPRAHAQRAIDCSPMLNSSVVQCGKLNSRRGNAKHHFCVILVSVKHKCYLTSSKGHCGAAVSARIQFQPWRLKSILIG